VGGPLSLARSVVIAGIRARYSLPRLIDSGAQVVEVPVTNDLDFEMSNAEARAIFDRGRAAATAQLANLDIAPARNRRLRDVDATLGGSPVVTTTTWTTVGA
jgi:hypothetical protein